MQPSRIPKPKKKQINEININQNKKIKTREIMEIKINLFHKKIKSSRKVFTFHFSLTNCKKGGQYKLQA
jgi:hypothetical protein